MFGGSASTGLDGNGGEDGNGNRAIGNVQEVDSCVDHIEVETSRMAQTIYIGCEEVESSQTSRLNPEARAAKGARRTISDGVVLHY